MDSISWWGKLQWQAATGRRHREVWLMNACYYNDPPCYFAWRCYIMQWRREAFAFTLSGFKSCCCHLLVVQNQGLKSLCACFLTGNLRRTIVPTSRGDLDKEMWSCLHKCDHVCKAPNTQDSKWVLRALCSYYWLWFSAGSEGAALFHIKAPTLIFLLPDITLMRLQSLVANPGGLKLMRYRLLFSSFTHTASLSMKDSALDTDL